MVPHVYAARSARVIAFIERYCLVPEGDLQGKPLVLDVFQKEFIREVYDGKKPGIAIRRAILSMARKNAKTALIATLVLVHVAGPEARQNSRIVSGAMSKEQAAEVYNYASKMVSLSPELSARVRVVPSGKRLIGLSKNVEYQAISAERKTAHGKSPVVAILDEVGQVRGPSDDFVDAIVTSQGAYQDALLLVISTQAATDGDLLSIWIDDAINSDDPTTVCHLYTAPEDCALDDRAAWHKANPALGKFRSLKDVEDLAQRAMRMPSSESSFRNLILNQRVEVFSPFITKAIWKACAAEPDAEAFQAGSRFVGLDLSARNDLTAAVEVVRDDSGVVHVRAHFWVPEDGLRERSRNDRVPYDVWAEQGFLRLVPGRSVDYAFVARDLGEILGEATDPVVAFDRWRIDLFQKELTAQGIELPLVPFGQGFKDMAPALDNAETLILNGNLRHGGNPALTMCMANARVEKDAAGNRKLSKARATGRIDGAVALVMAIGAMSNNTQEGHSFWEQEEAVTA